MLNFIATKLKIAFALAGATLYTLMCDRTKKVHIDYDVNGVACVRAVDKLELEFDSAEVFYEGSTSNHLRTSDQLLHRYGITKDVSQFEDTVNYDSFRAIVTLTSGEKTKLKRSEYESYCLYKQDQFRVVMPNGDVITDKNQYEIFVAGNKARNNPIEIPEHALDESFALSAV